MLCLHSGRLICIPILTLFVTSPSHIRSPPCMFKAVKMTNSSISCSASPSSSFLVSELRPKIALEHAKKHAQNICISASRMCAHILICAGTFAHACKQIPQAGGKKEIGITLLPHTNTDTNACSIICRSWASLFVLEGSTAGLQSRGPPAELSHWNLSAYCSKQAAKPSNYHLCVY